MAAILLFRNTNMAALTSCEALYSQWRIQREGLGDEDAPAPTPLPS